MPHLVDYNLEEDFPNLAASGWSITSNPTSDYNCIAFGVHDTTLCWDPIIKVHGYYWPRRARRDNSVESWIQVYGLYSFQKCNNADLEPGFEKVAFYVKDGEPHHVARQLENGAWTSKLGEDEDIEHNTLEALMGEKYGKVEVVMKRPHVKTVA